MSNLRAILLMVASMAGFAIEDMFIKIAARDLPTGQILLIIGGFGAVIFAIIVHQQGQSILSKGFFHPIILLRNGAEMIGTLGFITALALTPLTNATAIFQAAPLGITLGAALFLGESVGWRRWSAIAVGFLGVLIIIRPGLEGFTIASLWSVLAVVGLSVRDVVTRKLPSDISTMQVSAWAFMAVTLLGGVMLAVTGGARVLTVPHIGLMSGAVFFSIVAYWAVTLSMRIGEISAVAPFRYARLVFAMTIAIVVFKELPDRLTLLGTALIIGSGLYSFARERYLRQRTLPITSDAG